MNILHQLKIFLIPGLLFFLGNSAQGQEKLSPKQFKAALKNSSKALVLDVRTPKETSRSYIKDAVFMDIHDSLFEKRLATINKNLPVFVYCAIGVRSHDAAVMLKKMGFTNVYDLKGGIINWRLAGLDVEKGKDFDSRTGISHEDFLASIPGKGLVLVDFYAPWCAPCQIMVPALDSMATSMKDSVGIIKINADENLGIMKALQFNSLPYVMLYKNGKVLFKQDGFMSRDDMEMLVRKYY
jgi:thioredoxin 1